jgi:hyaluronan synthase
MLAFLLELEAWWKGGRFFPFAAFMLFIWGLWLVRIQLVRYYTPWRRAWYGTTSVIIPVVDEPLDLFRSVLERIREQDPTEIIVIINGPRNVPLQAVCNEVGVRWIWTATPGKRNALRIGVAEATGDIAVLVDSDTVWTTGTLSELIKPFRDPQVGGVTTRQRILDPERNVLTRWADWLESVRSEYSMPAMSVLGTVGCLPGRTIAFRRSILVECMDRFLTEKFLGILLEVSDDRTLTNYTLMAGYKCVYQSSSLVYTDAPLKLKKLIKQQSRWARGSQYNTLRMLPWMLRRARFLAVFYITDIIVPFVLIGTFVSWGYAFVLRVPRPSIYYEVALPKNRIESVSLLLALTVMMSLLSLSIRFGRHFADRPKDILYLPVFMAINTFVLLPIRLFGFFRMAHNAGWGTRDDSFEGDRQRSVKAVIPYLIGFLLLYGAVRMSV